MALHRSGRSGEAIRAYHEYRRHLQNELGLEPNRELVDLERAILDQDPSLEWQPPTSLAGSVGSLPAALLADEHSLIGRGQEFETLSKALSSTIDGAFNLVALSGEAGIGKSRLAAELARYAVDRHVVVAHGQSEPAASIPYRPLVEVLRCLVEVIPADELRAHLVEVGEDLLRVVPEIAHRVPGIKPSPHREPEAEQYYFFDAVARFIERLSRRRPVLLVFDDLQWADRSTSSALRALARNLQAPA